MRKKIRFGLVAVFLLLALAFHQHILDALYFSWNHKPYEKVAISDIEVMRKFKTTKKLVEGAVVSSAVPPWGFSYASFYDPETRTLFYRFENIGPNPTFLYSPMLSPLFGKSCIPLAGNQIVQFKIKNQEASKIISGRLRIADGCFAVGTVRSGPLIGIDLVVPK